MLLKINRWGIPLAMLMMLKTSVSAESIETKESASCFGSIYHALVEGGYSGSTDCQSSKFVIRKIGEIVTLSKIYTIYDLQYKTVPSPGLVSHGGQKILVFGGSNVYLGQYPLSPPPVHNMRIHGTSIYLDVSKKLGNQISFKSAIPPDKAYIDGELITFTK